MAGYVKMGVDDAINSRGPSPSIWKDCPVIDFQRDPAQGFFKFDDFKNSVLNINAAGATDFASGVGALHGDINWYVYCESDKVADVALQQDNDGVLLLQTDGTDADVTAITTGNNVQGIVNTPTAGNPSELWFEARVKFVTITDDDGGAFIGLAQPGEAKDAGGAMAAGGASLSDVDYVGFAQLSGDGDALKYAYNEATSGTAQSGSAQTLVAGTWYRLGFKVVKKGYDAEIRFFVDGVDQGDSAAIDISGTNANWPGNTDMDVLLAYVAESGASDGDGIYVDWVAVARKYA